MIRLLSRVVLVSFLLAVQAFGAKHCIRAGAGGLNDGSDWNNAYSSFAAVTWIRGDHYYWAAGTNVANVTFGQAVSGSTFIFLERANQTDNGSDVGWNAAYANGTAAIAGSVSFTSSYWWIYSSAGHWDSNQNILINDQNLDTATINVSANVDHIVATGVEAVGTGWASSTTPTDGWNWNADSGNRKGTCFTNCYCHGFTRNGWTLGGPLGTSYADPGIVFDGCAVTENGHCLDVNQHGQGIQIGFASVDGFNIINNMLFRNVDGTANIAFLGGSGSFHHNWRIINTVFMKTNGAYNVSSPGAVYLHTLAHGTNILILNCTVSGYGDGTAGNLAQFYDDSATNGACAVLNCLWESSYLSTTNFGWATNDYSGFFGNTGAGASGAAVAHQFNGGSSAFNDGANHDFRIKSGSYADGVGTDLSAIFNYDANNLPRTNWSLGAFGQVNSNVTFPTTKRASTAGYRSE